MFQSPYTSNLEFGHSGASSLAALASVDHGRSLRRPADNAPTGPGDASVRVPVGWATGSIGMIPEKRGSYTSNLLTHIRNDMKKFRRRCDKGRALTAGIPATTADCRAQGNTAMHPWKVFTQLVVVAYAAYTLNGLSGLAWWGRLVCKCLQAT